MATDTTPSSISQSARSSSCDVVVPNTLTFELPSGRTGPHTQCSELPTSTPATFGRTTGSEGRRDAALFFLRTVIYSPHAAMTPTRDGAEFWTLTWGSAARLPPA